MKTWMAVSLLGLALVACAGEDDDGPGGGGDAGATAGPTQGGDCTCDTPTSELSIECLCSLMHCPTYEEVIEVRDACTMISMSEGCGYVSHHGRTRGGTSTWTFDAETHELVAAYRVDDTPFGPCMASIYATATEPGESACDDVTMCSLCANDDNVCEL